MGRNACLLQYLYQIANKNHNQPRLLAKAILTVLLIAHACESGVCPTDFLPHGEKCYQYVGKGQDWTQAADHCQSLGGYLAEPKSASEYQYLKTLIKDNGVPNDVYIGGKLIDSEWTWVRTNDVIDYLPWSSPNPSGNAECLSLWGERDYGLDDHKCTDSTSVSVCEALPGAECPIGQRSCSDRTRCLGEDFICNGHHDCDDGSDEPNLACEWWTCKGFDRKCPDNRQCVRSIKTEDGALRTDYTRCNAYQPESVQAYHTEVTYEAAVKACQDKAGRIAQPKDWEDFYTVLTAARVVGGSLFWIGLKRSRDNEDLWHYEDGTNLTGWSVWSFAEPDNAIAPENCVLLNLKTDGWFDAPCDSLAYLVCELGQGKKQEEKDEEEEVTLVVTMSLSSIIVVVGFIIIVVFFCFKLRKKIREKKARRAAAQKNETVTDSSEDKSTLYSLTDFVSPKKPELQPASSSMFSWLPGPELFPPAEETSSSWLWFWTTPATPATRSLTTAEDISTTSTVFRENQ